MKVLFSADWHLGYELAGANRQSRLDDQIRNIELIARYIDEHGVDVLAIAGDVFEAQEKGAARTAIARMMEALAGPLSRGLRIVAVAGNHDRDWFMDTARIWLNAQAGVDDERIILRTRPELNVIEAGGERVAFALLPFPTPARYDVGLTDGAGAATHNERIVRRFTEVTEELRGEAERLRLPTVLLTHVTTDGTYVGPHRIASRDDIVVARGSFPSFEMTVVGHIHKAEQIGSSHFYYVGALDRMDVGEKDYAPRVLVADIGRQGVRSVASLPLDPTPFADIVATDEASMIAARDALPRPGDTLVRLTLELPYGTFAGPLLEAARRHFPRLYGNVEMQWQGVETQAPSVEGLAAANVEDTLRRYIEEQQEVKLSAEDRVALIDMALAMRRELLTEAAS